MRRIREYENDRLIAAGYEWGEPTTFRLVAALVLYAAGLVVGFSGVHVFQSAALQGAGMFAGGLTILGFASLVYLGRFRERSMIFEADGRMSAPQRLPGYWWPYYEITGHHDQIVDISRIEDQGADGKGVEHRAAIYFRSGNIVRVTDAVHRDDAHKVAVQLTKALEELRAACNDQRMTHAA